MKRESLMAAIENVETKNNEKKEAWLKQASDVKEESMENFRESENNLKILRKYAENPPTNNAEIEELCTVLCWDNVGYCCPIRKQCTWRNLVLAILNVDSREFTRKKEALGVELEKRSISTKPDALKESR